MKKCPRCKKPVQTLEAQCPWCETFYYYPEKPENYVCGKLCLTCYYVGHRHSINTCDYILVTGKPRGCSVKDCKHYTPSSDYRKQVITYSTKRPKLTE